jgi:quinol monooxygenase YgiN
MATILARVTVRPGCSEQFEQVARELYERSHAAEPGLQRYEYARGHDERSYYTMFAFDGYHDFLAHQASPHHVAATPALRDLIESISLEWLDPVPGASPLSPTARTAPDPAGLDQAMREHAGRHPMVVAGWWPTE